MLEQIYNNMKKSIDIAYKINFQMDNSYENELNNVSIVDAYKNLTKLYDSQNNSFVEEAERVINDYKLESANEYYNTLMNIGQGNYEKSGNKFKTSIFGEDREVDTVGGVVSSIATKNKKYFYEGSTPVSTFYKDTGVMAKYAGQELKYQMYDEATGETRPVNYSEYNSTGLNNSVKYNIEKLVNNEGVKAVLKKYNILDDAQSYLEGVNNQTTNEIFDSATNILHSYIGKESEFKEDYGFDMYNVNSDGKIKFNDKALIVNEYCKKYIRDK